MAEQVRDVFAISTDVISGLGRGTEEHWNAIANGERAIKLFSDAQQEYYASRISEDLLALLQKNQVSASLFEKLCIEVAENALQRAGTIDRERTVLILSTTKGNIDMLNAGADESTLLSASAQVISGVLGLTASPIVVSHACISGSVALLYAHRLLSGGRYDNAIVVGADLFTPFVLNGFLSFQAIADGPCRPFDANRTGINLGEAAAAVVLSVNSTITSFARLLGGATSNDANHISGPSRTGAELSDAVNRAMREAGVSSAHINMISAHGTATAYNDEMEAKALNLSGLSDTPLHSMKSYTGHTLGAAGVLESVMVLKAIQEQKLIPSAGFETLGVPVPVNVTTAMQPATINYVLKTASGFGGSNAAIIWAKA